MRRSPGFSRVADDFGEGIWMGPPHALAYGAPEAHFLLGDGLQGVEDLRSGGQSSVARRDTTAVWVELWNIHGASLEAELPQDMPSPIDVCTILCSGRAGKGSRTKSISPARSGLPFSWPGGHPSVWYRAGSRVGSIL